MKTKSILLTAIMMAVSTLSTAQAITVPEPEFANSYYMLTSDSTYKELPKENGTLVKHTSLASRIGKIAGHAADVVGAAGAIGAVTSNSIGGMVDGVRVMSTAANVGDAANSITGLTFAEGLDIVFEGAHSPYVTANSKDIRIVVNNGANNIDPRDLFRIVRFKEKKKNRQIRWQTITPSLFGTTEAEKIGYANFTGHRYGNYSYVITISAAEAKPGEYGIFYMSLASASEIPVATFSIQ
jgi:hypothetical protein